MIKGFNFKTFLDRASLSEVKKKILFFFLRKSAIRQVSSHFRMIFRVSVMLVPVIPKVDGVIDWTVIYPVDSAIQLLNNWGMDRTFRQCLTFQQPLR